MTSVEEFNCILCKETFDNKDELQIHFRKHGDPKFNESIKTKSRNQNEAAVANEKSNDASEMVNCDVCDEVFPTISKAITHKHKVHPEHDAKYFCPWCGKLFTMKHLYNKHLHSNHDAIEEIPESNDSHFHCDSCNVYFFIPAAMVYHNKFFHRQDTDLPIIGHSKKQKLFNQDLLPVYYCSFCGEEYINKVNLQKHICDDHGDENQRPTDVLRCPLCEAIFYHLDAYELHLTFHSSEDLYSETNEMNEKDMLEFSLETVPPVMERIEDLNNLPDVESGVNAIGIESFLQMAMDEPKDINQLPGKIKSKKHKKHKKSKKAAITLDEFLSMNQDVFGEDLHFQGIEEVPTKVITSQLKVKKPTNPKTGAKFASSADLQKLQKQGIVVKVQSGNKPPSQIRPTGQPVKVNQQVKNIIQTKTKAISASNEVLSKLLNQSSNQLKIVKKPTHEMLHNDELDNVESPTDYHTDDTINKKPEASAMACETIESNGDEKEKKQDGSIPNISPVCSPEISPTNNQENKNSHTEDNSMIVTDWNSEKDNKQSIYENSESENVQMKQVKIHQTQAMNINQNVSPGNKINDTLKNIGKHITIKSVTPLTVKTRVEDKPGKHAIPEVNKGDAEQDQMSPDTDLGAEHIDDVNQKNKSLDTLKNLNSAITIKSLKNTSVPGQNKISAISNEKTEKIVKLNNSDSSPVKLVNLENSTETASNACGTNKEKSVNITPSNQVLKNISRNITIKPMSPAAKSSKGDVIREENYDSDFDNHEDEITIENKNNSVSSTPDRLQILSPGNNLNSDVTIKPAGQSPCSNKRVVANTEDKIFDDETSNIQSSNNILKHLKNITAKPVSATTTMKSEAISKPATNVKKESIGIKRSQQTKEIRQDIEIFNIDDSDDEVEPKRDKIELAAVKLEPTKSDHNTHASLNAIKNVSKNITIKSSNNQIMVKEIVKKDESNAELFSDADEMHDDAGFDDDFEDHPHINKSMLTQKFSNNKAASLKNVLKNLSKHITVKSGNASPNPSIKSLDHTSQDFDHDTPTYDTDSDEESYTGKVKITEIAKEDEDEIGHTNNCDNSGIVTQSPEDSNSGDERITEDLEDTVEFENQNIKIRPTHSFKPTSEGLLKNISKNIIVKSLSEKIVDNEGKTCKRVIPENELIANQTKLCKDLLIKPIKQSNPENQNDSNNVRTPNIPNNKRIEGPGSKSPNVQSKHGVVNTVNKEVKVKTFQSETVIEEITTTVTKTIRRVNQTVNQHQQVFNASQVSNTPRMIKPKTGPRMGGIQSNNLRGLTVRQATPDVVRPKIRQAVPFRPASSTIVRPSNQLVSIRPTVPQVRPSSNPRMQIKNMPRQQRPIGRPLKISPNVVNQTLKRPGNEESPGHFSCFKKPKESLIPINETGTENASDFQYASSSQMSKFCSTTQTIKGNSVLTTTQMKSESLSQQQQINRLGNVSGLKIAKTNQVSRVEKTEINASKRTTLEAIEKLQKQGLLVKKPRIEENSDLPKSDDEHHEEFDGDDYDD